MLSLTCSYTTLCLSECSSHYLKKISLNPNIPISKTNSSSLSSTFPSNGKWVSFRIRFHAKSAKSETDTNPQNPKQKITISANDENPSGSFLSLLCPLLKLFGGRDPSQERSEILEVSTSSLSTLARLPWGSKSLSSSLHNQVASEDPPLSLQLFEFEACPFCRRVREAMTELDLSSEVYPCPKGSLRHREMVKKIGGKEQFPFLVDPNAGISMYESGEIVKYLFQRYGQERKPSFGLLESTLFTGWMPTILRAGRGLTLWERAKREPPSKKLELYSYENNPYARIVREALCELELPYILRNVGEGSSNSELLFKTSGSKEVPYLVDPNTGAKLGNYKEILPYLFQTYSIVN
ncbi:thioredoxin family protein [Tasmannia lanceolata]|uniref:thioredoxin family protein n=1 Tax=Tasmannia lanceolata TaxID=3420 RepID=UPI004062E4FA